jgi:hypothetical protein
MFNNTLTPGSCKAQTNDIVVTHHLPSYNLVHKQYQGDPSNQFFVTEMSEYMKKTRPYAWFYGHTHRASNKILEHVWCVCNPFGYPREISTMYFDENLVLDITL